MTKSDVSQCVSATEHGDELLKVTARMAQVGGWELDCETSCVQWTEQTYRIHELPQGASLALNEALSFYHPEDRAVLVSSLQQAEQRGTPYALDLRLITAKGNHRHVRAICRPVMNGARTVRLQGTIQDVTEQKQAEEALAYERRRLLDVLRSTNAGTWEWNVETGVVQFDERWAAILGLSLADLESATVQTWREMCHPEDRQKSDEMMEQCFRRELEYYELETRRRHASGEWIWVLDRGRVAKWTPDGRPLTVSGLQLDITQRKKTLAALQESEARYRDIFENNSAIKLLIDPDTGRIVEANSAACEFYQYSYAEITRLRIGDINLETDRELQHRIDRVRANLLLDFEVKHRLSTGELRDVHVYAGPVRIDEQVLLHSIVFDITERKRAEEALLRMHQLESLGTLAGGIAHDFNNVLTGVFGNVSLALLTLDADHPATRFLKKAEQSITRAAGLSNQLLTFAKGGAPVRSHISLVQLITEVVQFDLSGSNVRPDFDFPAELHDVHVDKGQLQQVFSNLALNADQAMPNGGTLFVSAKNVQLQDDHPSGLEPGRYVSVTVTDQGCGIEAADLKRVFEPYFSTKATGHGLGLATSYSIIQRHKGQIRVESEVGSGTTFTILLPASPPTGVERFEIPPSESCSDRTSRRVLVMDDDPQILEVVSAMLNSINVKVKTCADTAGAVAAYQSALDQNQRFDLVFLDLTIPGGPGGKEAVKRILELDPEAKVLCSSGYADDRAMADFTDYGFCGVLPKPYTIADLQTVVEKFSLTVTAKPRSGSPRS